jgi:multisubunit Na+/H+ antiporter MnhE subunit
MSITPQEQQSAGALVPVGYILAVVMPLVGFVIGIVVATRPQKVTSKHGAWIIVVSVIAFIIYFAIIINAAQSATTCTGYYC